MRRSFAAFLLVAGCNQAAPAPVAPVVPVNQTTGGGNLTSLNERGLGPTSVEGPTTPAAGRPMPAETVEIIVRPGDAEAKKSLAWYMADEETTFFDRRVREDGSVVYHFLRKAGLKAPADKRDGVRVFQTSKQ